MFTQEHFIWIGICAFIIVGLAFLSLKMEFSFRTSALVMAGVAVVSEISKILSDMELVNGKDATEGMVLDPKSLPFHLCSLLIFAFIYLPFAKDGKVKSFILSLTVPVGLVGSVLAILMATSGTDFADIDSYQCFIYHAVMTWFSVYLVASKQVELGEKVWLTNLVSLFGMSIVMIWVNSILSAYDTNFWYVVRPPVEALPILNLEHGWYVYYLSLLLIGFIGVTAVHLPFIIKEKQCK